MPNTKHIEYGASEGETCNRQGCKGIIMEREVEGCSCHICPPCGACTTPNEYCPVCDWQAKDDEQINDYVVNINRETGVYRTWTERALDSTKIDWTSHSHTNSSMIKRGVYPEGTTQEDVRKLVIGTFGGRFNSFGDGRFEYVAYTD